MDEAYLQAVRDAIRTKYDLDVMHCEVTADGKAHPDAGEWYYAVWPGDLANSAQNCLDEQVSVNVTVTMRTGFTPPDRVGVSAIVPAGGLIRRVKELRAFLHMNYDVLDAANVYLNAAAGAETAGFKVPLMFQNARYLGPKGPDWFWADPTGEDAITGLAVQITLGRARRVQYIESET